MTVYLDDLRFPTLTDAWETEHWSRLVTDDPTLAELHATAQHAQLPAEWFRAHDEINRYRPHYVIPDTRRDDALAVGAVAVGWADAEGVVARIEQAHHRGPDRPGAWS